MPSALTIRGRRQLRRRQKIVAVSAAMTLHAVWLVMLAWAPGVLELPSSEDLAPPVELSLVPGGEGPGRGQAASAAAAGAGRPSGEAPSQPSLAAAPGAPSQPSLAPAPAQPARLEPPRALAVAPQETAPPALAARALPPRTDSIPAAPRPASPTELRSAPSLALAAPEPPAPRLAARPAPLPAPSATAAARPATPNLGSVQGYAPPAAEAPPILAERPAAPQAPAATAVARSALAPGLAPAPAYAPAAADPGDPLVLAPRAAGPQTAAASPSRPAGAAAGALRPAPSMAAGTLGPAGDVAAGGPRGSARAGPQGAGGGPGGRGAGVHPGCEPEVLMLLTPAERERCRNQLDAEAQRRANRLAGAETARRVGLARGAAWLDGIDPEKRAYYDAVAASNAAVRGQVGGGRPAGLACSLSGLFGGPSGLPAQKVKIPGLPCVIVPPVGAFAEETRLSPP